MNISQIETLELAARLLYEEAAILSKSYTLGGYGNNWLENCSEKQRHDLFKKTAGDLRVIAYMEGDIS